MFGLSGLGAKLAGWAVAAASLIASIMGVYLAGQSKGRNDKENEIKDEVIKSAIEDEKAEQNIDQAKPDDVRSVGRKFMRNDDSD